MDKIQKVILDMLMHNTGIAMMDSGGGEGRMWQRNAKRDITKDEPVTVELPEAWYTLTDSKGAFVRRDRTIEDLAPYRKDGDTVTHEKPVSDEIELTVSLYHYLPEVLELDELCEEFNAMPVDDWDGEAYGVSKAGEEWLKAHGLTIGDAWNTYNGENYLSQVLQGANVYTEDTKSNFEYPPYVLLQVHGGADVRGGYTDAKLFKMTGEGFINPTPYVSATLTRASGETVELETSYHGHKFATENGESVEILAGDKIEASLMI